MKFKNYAPALLASGIVGFVLGIGAFSFYVNKPFKNMGSLPDWIGALTTITAGVWAYTRFRKETAEKTINQPVILEWNIKQWRIKDPTDYGSDQYVNAYLVNIHNPTERSVHIKTGYLKIYPSRTENELYSFLEMDLNSGSYTLGFDEYAEFRVLKTTVGDVIKDSFNKYVTDDTNKFILTPNIILSNDDMMLPSEDVKLEVMTYEII